MPGMVRSAVCPCRSQRRGSTFCALGFAAALLVCCPLSRGEEVPLPVRPDHAEKMEAGLALFQSQVRGVLTRHCLECHGGKKTEADLSLVDRDKLLEGGASGPAILPGKSADSLV